MRIKSFRKLFGGISTMVFLATSLCSPIKTFIRKVSATCGTQIVIPDYEVKRDLPLNEPVLVKFTPKKSGEFSFTCGMGMLRGSLIVR